MMTKRLSHAYMLVSPAGEKRNAAAQKLAASLLCGGDEPPCGECRDCRKALAGIHPDVIRVERQRDDKGKPRREIYVDQIRAVTADAVIAPNEAQRKVYILDDADCMNPQAQNALLKALEDPPGHACFILCTASADALLPTVRSRVVRLDGRGEKDAAASELMPFAREYVQLVGLGNRARLALFCMNRAKLTREEALEFVECVRTLVCDALCGRGDAAGLSKSALLRLNGRMDQAELYLRRNLTARQVFGLLAAVSVENGKEE